jgi:hypothetical protein
MNKDSKWLDDFLDKAINDKEKSFLDKSNIIKNVFESQKALADAEKSKAEAENAKKPQPKELTRLFISTLAPMITAIVLIVTLWFQINQNKENTLSQVQSAEDASWREMLNKVGVKNAGENITTPTLIKSFYPSKKYGAQAREISILFLGNIVDRAHFKLLFNDIVTSSGWKNLNQLVTLSNILKRQLIEINKQNRLELAFEVGEELAYVASEIIKILNMHDSTRPKDIDLRGVIFNHLNLSGVDFSGSDLAGTQFTFCSVSNAHFTNVINYDDEFEPSTWEGTAWWRTSHLDRGLIKYLKNNFPKTDSVKYWQSRNDTTNYALSDNNNYMKLY